MYIIRTNIIDPCTHPSYPSILTTYLPRYISTKIHTCIYMHACTYTRTHTYIHACLPTYIHIHTYIINIHLQHTHTLYIYTHYAYTQHTYTHTLYIYTAYIHTFIIIYIYSIHPHTHYTYTQHTSTHTYIHAYIHFKSECEADIEKITNMWSSFNIFPQSPKVKNIIQQYYTLLGLYIDLLIWIHACLSLCTILKSIKAQGDQCRSCNLQTPAANWSPHC